MECMATSRPPHESSIFLDVRGEGRSLRVTWHHEGPGAEGPGAEGPGDKGSGDGGPDGGGLVVLSLWRENVCAGSFRLRAAEVPDLVAMLKRGLAATYDDLRSDTVQVGPVPRLEASSDRLGDTA